MLYLILSIICSALIGNLLILFDKDKKADIMLIFLGNYCLATLFSLIMLKNPVIEATSTDIILGSFTGVLFLVNFIIYRRNIQLNGLSLSVSTMRVSLLIPTIMSLLCFGDRIGLFNYLGITTVLAAFIWITEFKSYHNLLFIVMLFFFTGIADSVMKIYNETGIKQEDIFVLFLFSSALIANLTWIMIKRRKFIWKYFGFGLLLGIPNQLTTRFFLRSLDSVPAPVAYPLFASSVVLICVFSDILIWKKRYTVRQRLAYAAIIIGIVFLNVKY